MYPEYCELCGSIDNHELLGITDESVAYICKDCMFVVYLPFTTANKAA